MSGIESTNSFSYPATGRGAQDSEQEDSARDSAMLQLHLFISYANLETSSRDIQRGV